MLGVMLDCSRNAVMTVDSVKKYVKIIAKMGYDTLMLYTEDTFEVDNEPLFGYLRGRYSKAELKEIDRFCIDNGIELVPCIQTLAHLNCMFKWREYDEMRDCDDIVLIDEPRTYRLIENIMSTVAECFTSRRIHIGMDEAYRVGAGKFFEKHGFEDRFDIISRHLRKVCDIAGKHGFKPMIWSDMMCRAAQRTGDYYNDADIETIKKRSGLPENLSLVYWDYYSEDPERYKRMIDINKAFGREVVFAGGIWTWQGFAPDNRYSISTAKAALEACREKGVDNVIMTVWGDDGAECSKFSVLPALMYIAELAHGNTDENSIKSKFKDMFGFEFDTMLMLDELNSPTDNRWERPNKYLLYNDLFTGINDWKIKESFVGYYNELTKRLSDAYVGEYEYIFKTAVLLGKICALKSDICLRLRKAYRQKDEAELSMLATGDLNDLIKLVEEFHFALQNQWFKENKPNGFDIQDIRLGGVIQRTKSCQTRLLAYLNKEISDIPELAEEVIKGECGEAWGRYVSPNVISHV